jgi:serine protease Do
MNAIAARLTVLLLAALLLLPVAARADLPDFTALVEKYAPAVVNITARKSSVVAEDPSALDPEEAPDLFRYFFGPNGPHNRGQMPERISGGSGFIVSADGYILTNHHVVEGADEVMVRLKDRRELRAKVIGSDEQSDVALLKVEATGLPAVMLGDSNKLKPGQWVVAIGSPLNFDYSVTAGVVSAVGRAFSGEQRYVPFIQTDVAINRGNSGGPLFNLAGEVVGINSQIISASGGYMGLSFAIPIEVANGVVQQLKSKGKVSRGSLGVLIQRVGAAEAQALELPRIGGALVSEIHGNFIVNEGGATAADVLALITQIKERAQKDRGIDLHTEVQIVGEERGSA